MSLTETINFFQLYSEIVVDLKNLISKHSKVNANENKIIKDQNLTLNLDNQKLGTTFDNQKLGTTFDNQKLGTTFDNQKLGTTFDPHYKGIYNQYKVKQFNGKILTLNNTIYNFYGSKYFKETLQSLYDKLSIMYHAEDSDISYSIEKKNEGNNKIITIVNIIIKNNLNKYLTSTLKVQIDADYYKNEIINIRPNKFVKIELLSALAFWIHKKKITIIKNVEKLYNEKNDQEEKEKFIILLRESLKPDVNERIIIDDINRQTISIHEIIDSENVDKPSNGTITVDLNGLVIN